MRYLQHPLLVLLLVVAGARLELSADLLGLVAAYVVFRIIGKLAGGWLASRVVARELPRDLGFSLSSPGVMGIALAVNVLQADGDAAEAATLFTIVLVGSLGSELLRLLASRAGRAR